MLPPHVPSLAIVTHEVDSDVKIRTQKIGGGADPQGLWNL